LAKVAPTVKTSLPAFNAIVFVSCVCSAALRPNTKPEPPSPEATWFSTSPDAATCCSSRTPAALKTFNVMAFARVALAASGLNAVVTVGVASEPGSARLTTSASSLALAIARSANVNTRDCDAPPPASPKTLPLNRTPPLSVVELPAPCRKSVVKVAPTPWPDSCAGVS
jgi:hypothetical protein